MSDLSKTLVKNVLDKYKKYEKTNISTYTNFLDMREYKLVTDILKRLKIEFNTYVSSVECEKSIIYFGEYEDFVSIYKISIDSITHKDILGTLFSIGYVPNIIGDIFVHKDKVYLTNLTRLNSFLETNLYMIKNKRVELEKVDELEVNEDRFIDLKIVIPSYRLDVIVSKLAHLSRSDVNKYIKDKAFILALSIVIYFVCFFFLKRGLFYVIQHKSIRFGIIFAPSKVRMIV